MLLSVWTIKNSNMSAGERTRACLQSTCQANLAYRDLPRVASTTGQYLPTGRWGMVSILLILCIMPWYKVLHSYVLWYYGIRSKILRDGNRMECICMGKGLLETLCHDYQPYDYRK